MAQVWTSKQELFTKLRSKTSNDDKIPELEPRHREELAGIRGEARVHEHQDTVLRAELADSQQELESGRIELEKLRIDRISTNTGKATWPPKATRSKRSPLATIVATTARRTACVVTKLSWTTA